MKKLLAVFSVLIFILIGFGWNSDSEMNHKQVSQEESKKQFMEVLSNQNQLVGIMEDSNSIEEFTKKLDIPTWNYCDQLAKGAKLKYTYKDYEVVDDPFYLKGKKPYIIQSKMEFYVAGDDYYVVDCAEDDKDIAKVSKSTGQFLSVPKKLNLDTKKTPKLIIKKWTKEIDGLQMHEQTKEVDPVEDKKVELSAADVTKTSKDQKIVILDKKKDKVLYSTSNITEITEIFNVMSSDEWQEVSQIPNSASVERYFIQYALNRKIPKKELNEMYRFILYKEKNNYYIKEIILNNGTQKTDYITSYKIPKETGEYIISLRDN